MHTHAHTHTYTVLSFLAFFEEFLPKNRLVSHTYLHTAHAHTHIHSALISCLLRRIPAWNRLVPHTYLHAYTHRRTHTYMHTYVYIYTYTQCSPFWPSSKNSCLEQTCSPQPQWAGRLNTCLGWLSWAGWLAYVKTSPNLQTKPDLCTTVGSLFKPLGS